MNIPLIKPDLPQLDEIREPLDIGDDHDLFEVWDGTPGLALCTKPMTHRRDEFTGILNLPSDFSVKSAEDDSVLLEMSA